ncbi:hypothetical protein [Metallibacterium sp.]|jgi:ElaB/YqjD/DUF883 family membrane-anchored ribosome-binding protein|uniref:DUF883 family protein n=1 Tax=Metallibacterium sp. TaxID=2940281 RepID=UPI00262A26B4|nr:hypothetical protein [Metallibacterium sp.]
MNSEVSNPSEDRIHATAERAKQTESAVVKHTAERVEHGLHRATDVGADVAAGVNDKAAEMAARGREAAEKLRAQAGDLFDKTRDFVREKPGQAVLIAAATGWLLGRLMRR